VSRFAVAALTHPAAASRCLHITGPQSLTGVEAVAIAERVTGKRFSVQRLPVPILRVLRLALMPFNPRLASLFAMGEGMQVDDLVAMEPLWREFDVQPTTFEAYVRSLQDRSGRYRR